MATSGGAAAAFKVPAATGHAVHIRDSPLILRYAQTPASASVRWGKVNHVETVLAFQTKLKGSRDGA